MTKIRVVANDRMQQGYVYFRTEPVGQNFDPDFRPELTPPEMLALGVFGGRYMTDCTDEFPADWFKAARLCPERHDPALNLFGVNASQPLAVWREKGWLHDDDPRGWFQWYCRYYMGRRSPDDQRQIKRWRAMRRHIAQIKNNCRPGDLTCRRKQRQALLHWAYDSRVILVVGWVESARPTIFRKLSANRRQLRRVPLAFPILVPLQREHWQSQWHPASG